MHLWPLDIHLALTELTGENGPNQTYQETHYELARRVRGAASEYVLPATSGNENSANKKKTVASTRNDAAESPTPRPVPEAICTHCMPNCFPQR